MFGAANPSGQSSSSPFLGQSSSSPFEQSPNSPFGSPWICCQPNSTGNNPFAPKPLGGANPFSSPQSGSFLFGGPSTGALETGQPSAPAFLFGSSSSPAFGNSPSLFGGGFGSTSSQTSTFEGTSQPSEPSLGSGMSGASAARGSSTPPLFRSISRPASGMADTCAFGGGSTPPFGTTTAPLFGSIPMGGACCMRFARGTSNTSVFGTGGAFGVTSTPTFCSSNTAAIGTVSSAPAFGASTSCPCGAPSCPSFSFGSPPPFGASAPCDSSTPPPFRASTPAFGGSASTPAFRMANSSAFGGGSTPSFGTTTAPLFGSIPTGGACCMRFACGTSNTPVFGTGGAFGVTSTPAPSCPSMSVDPPCSLGQSAYVFTSPSPFGVQMGSHAATPTICSPGFWMPGFRGQHRRGSRATQYAATDEQDFGAGAQPYGKLESISAMPVYVNKSHEELRWEDYASGDKGGPNPAGRSGASASSNPATGFNPQSSPFSSTTTAPNPFSCNTSSNLFSSTTLDPFALKAFNTGDSSGPSTSFFGPTSSTSVPGQTAPSFAANTSPSLFPSACQSTFGPTPPILQLLLSVNLVGFSFQANSG